MADNTVKKTCRLNLCTSCGVCSCVCPVNAIVMEFANGQFIPRIDDRRCTLCGLCLKLCPGIDIFPDNKKSYSDIIRHDSYIECYNAYCNDPDIRSISTSGGVITALIIALIEAGRYDEAFVVPFNRFGGTEAMLTPCSDTTIIRDCSGSKYVPVSVENVIESLRKYPDKRSIIVATPCQLAGIRKYIEHYRISEDNLFFMGIFCHKTLNFNAIEYFEYRYANGNEKLVDIKYRTKEQFGWPGHTKLVFDSGRQILVDESIRLMCKTFFQLNRCLFCLDKFNMRADISFGDCYLPDETDSRGKSNIIIRTEKGKNLFSDFSRLFTIVQVNIEEIKRSQDFYKEKQQRFDHTCLLARKMGLSLPWPEHNKWYHKAKRRLAKSQKYIRFGQQKRFWRIDFISLLFNLKHNQDLKWYCDTIRFAFVSVAGVLEYLFGFLRWNKKKKGNNIIIVGAELFNKGAQAMTFSVVNCVSKRYPDKKCVLFSYLDFNRDQAQKDMYRFSILPWDYNIKRRLFIPFSRLFIRTAYISCEQELKKVLKDAFCIIDISGYGLSSQFGDFKSFDYILNIMIAHRFKIPFYIFPQSIGPFDYSSSRKPFIIPLIRLFLKYPEKIYIREDHGIECLKQFGLKIVEKSCDIVLRNQSYELSNIYKRSISLKKRVLKSGAVGVIPNQNVAQRMPEHAMYGLYESLVERLVDEGRIVYILRHSFEDLAVCRKIKMLFPNNEKVVLVGDELNAIEIEDTIKQCDFIIGSRYHAVVHGYKNGVPAIVLGWAVKYKELLSRFDQLRYYFDCRDKIDLPEVLSCLDSMLSTYPAEQKHILATMRKLDSELTPFDIL